MTARKPKAPTAWIPQWTFGDRLRRIRTSMDMHQTEFAELIGEKGSTYSAWESGRNTPRGNIVAAAKRVQLATGVPASWLLDIDDGPTGVRHQGLEPRTRWCRVTAGQRTNSNVIHIRFPAVTRESAGVLPRPHIDGIRVKGKRSDYPNRLGRSHFQVAELAHHRSTRKGHGKPAPIPTHPTRSRPPTRRAMGDNCRGPRALVGRKGLGA